MRSNNLNKTNSDMISSFKMNFIEHFVQYLRTAETM